MDPEDLQNEGEEVDDEEHENEEQELVDPETLPNGSKTVIVGGWSTVRTITSALEQCEAGDSVLITAGEYDESVDLAKADVGLRGPVDLSAVILRSVTSTSIGGSLTRLGIRGGVSIRAGNLGLYECDITSPDRNGIQVFRLANPTVRGCSVHDIGKSHIYVFPEGRGRYDRNELLGDGRRGSVGLFLDDAKDVLFQSNAVANVMTGVYARGRCEGCEVKGNVVTELTGHGVYVDGPGTHPTVRGNRIAHAQHHCVVVSNQGKGLIADNVVYGSVSIHPGCRPSLFRNVVVAPGKVVAGDAAFAVRGVEVKPAEQLPKGLRVAPVAADAAKAVSAGNANIGARS